MKIRQVIGQVLSRGCGIELADAVKSARYKELVNQEKALSKRSPASSDMGIALRSGHLLMGRLFNTQSERGAIATAKASKGALKKGKLRALTRFVGEQLIAAAKDCFDNEIRELMARWNNSDATVQIEVLRSLFFTLVSDSQQSQGTSSFEKMRTDMARHWEANSYDAKKVLPKEFGIWNKKSCIANCQGKSQLLVAFARSVKANAMAVHPIIQAGDVVKGWRANIRRKIVEDISARGLACPADFSESICASDVVETTASNMASFHVCIAIELCDGRWVMMDPHAFNWGIFSDKWKLAEKFAQLRKYAPVLPGLNLLGFDHEVMEKKRLEVETQTDQILERSGELQKMIAGCKNILDLIDVMTENWVEMQYLMKGLAPDSKLDLSSPDIRRMAAMQVVAGGDMSIDSLTGKFLDPRFLEVSKGSILTAYHAIAINLVREHVATSGDFVHPECEFALPEYSAAISAINSVLEKSSAETNRFFLEHSFDQVSLRNALLDITMFVHRENPDEELAYAAADTLRMLPMLHPIAKRSLSMIRKKQ